jgi:peptidyl-prolyl cis-trans isomerase D
MFDKMRAAVKDSWLIKGLMGLLMISFGIFGIGDFVGTGALDPNIALKVGSREVNVVDFQRRFDQEYTRFKESVRGQLPDTEMFRRSVMDTMVQEMTRTTLLESGAEDLGVVITDEQLRNTIRQLDAFKDPITGNFSQITYSEVLRNNKLTETMFLDLLRADLRQQAIVRPVALGGYGPGFLTDSLFAFRNEGRTADTLLVASKAIAVNEKPTDADLKTIYDQNAANFMRPEYRKLSAISLKASDLVKAESFAEEELKSYYDQNANRFQTTERRRVSQLAFDSKEEAEKVRALAAPGDTLATLAAKAQLGPPIDLGEQSRDSVVGKSMGPAFDLPVNEISQAVQSDLGWHIFTSTSVTAGQTTPYEQAKDAIRKSLVEERGLDAVYKASTEVQDALAAGTPMPEIAANLGLPVMQIESIDQAGRDPKGAEVQGLYDRNTLLTTAFTLPAGGDSGLKDLPDRDGYYVVKVEGITPPAPRPIEEVRSEITAIWQREKTMTEGRKVADSLAAEIGAATVMSSLETKDGKVTYGLIGPITRAGAPLDRLHMVDTGRLSATMLEKLFTAKPGEVFVADAGEGIVIVRLKDITVPQPVGPMSMERNEINMTLRNAITGDMMEQMNADFTQRYPVEVNRTVIDTMVKQAR